MKTFDLRWHRIDVEAAENYRPPFFSGSMLRGAIGVALKRVVCINPSYKCEGCFAAADCLYHQFYESPNRFHPYRIVAPLGSDRLKFSLYLFEDAVTELPYMLSAIKMAMEEIGLGREKQPVDVKSMKVGRRVVYEDGRFLSLNGLEPRKLKNQKLFRNARIAFRLPLRIKQQNRLAKEVELHTLINSIHQRYRQLKQLEPEKLGYRVEGEIVQTSMRRLDLHRYSNRQRTPMKLGGLIGEMTIRGLDETSALYLELGEILGVGKQTVFGLGTYTLTPLKEDE